MTTPPDSRLGPEDTVLGPRAQLGRYQLLARIGTGGMGEVYRAADTRLGREVAVKVLSPRLLADPRALTRFEQEARAVAALSHPNVLALHDFGRDGGITFAVMELLEGEPLDRRLAAERLGWRKALEIAAAVADGLASAHARGIVHRDLKPANIFITTSGLVKILDFGLTGAAPAAPCAGGVPQTTTDTETAGFGGTVGYMAPEQVSGEPGDARADIFSLGCVLYELLTGRKAFQCDSAPETLSAILRDQPASLDESGRGIPARVQSIVRRCLEKNPDQRYQSARDLGFSLRAALEETRSWAPRLPPARVVLPIVALIVIAGVLWSRPWRRPPPAAEAAAPVRSIAVLPLTNLSANQDEGYFADAMTDELIARLARARLWRVTSRTSSMAYRGTQKKTADIARELGVDALIEGSVVRDGSRVKISVELVDARTDRHLWGDTYEREIENVLAIQTDVAQAIATEVNLTLTPAGRTALTAASRPVLQAAYEAYVRGRYAWNKRGESDLRDAIRFFQESLDADPTYAPAYAGLADCYGQLGYGSYVSPEDAFPRARAAAQRALELDPMLAEAHASLGYALMYYDWDFKAAEAEYRRAIELDPNYATAHQWYAYLLTAMERPLAEAEREIATAKTLDPLSVSIATDRAYILHYYGRNDEALRSVRTALEMNPRFALGYFWLARIYTSEGRYADALAAFQHLGALRAWTPAMAALGFAQAKAGHNEEARTVLAEFAELARQGRYASSYAIGVIYAGLGDRERALSSLEAAYRERSHWLVWLTRDPRWNDIRTDARFRELARKVGLLGQNTMRTVTDREASPAPG